LTVFLTDAKKRCIGQASPSSPGFNPNIPPLWLVSPSDWWAGKALDIAIGAFGRDSSLFRLYGMDPMVRQSALNLDLTEPQHDTIKKVWNDWWWRDRWAILARAWKICWMTLGRVEVWMWRGN
jgi:hypothetical protein